MSTNDLGQSRFDQIISHLTEISESVAKYSLSHEALIDERNTLRRVVRQTVQERDTYLEALRELQNSSALLHDAMNKFLNESRKLTYLVVARLDEGDIDIAYDHLTTLRQLLADMQRLSPAQ